jgi:hypothetical protein
MNKFTPLVCAVCLFLIIPNYITGMPGFNNNEALAMSSDPCNEYDYQELKDMSIKELESTYCKELETTKSYGKMYFSGIEYAGRGFDSCIKTLEQIIRVHNKKSKHQITKEEFLDKCGN